MPIINNSFKYSPVSRFTIAAAAAINHLSFFVERNLLLIDRAVIRSILIPLARIGASDEATMRIVLYFLIGSALALATNEGVLDVIDGWLNMSTLGPITQR